VQKPVEMARFSGSLAYVFAARRTVGQLEFFSSLESLRDRSSFLDYQQKTMTLEAEEFIRRFLLHVLPDGFQRIRCYGFMANRYREQKLARCRELLDMPAPDPPPLEGAN
jgi:hypothetical protein